MSDGRRCRRSENNISSQVYHLYLHVFHLVVAEAVATSWRTTSPFLTTPTIPSCRSKGTNPSTSFYKMKLPEPEWKNFGVTLSA